MNENRNKYKQAVYQLKDVENANVESVTQKEEEKTVEQMKNNGSARLGYILVELVEYRSRILREMLACLFSKLKIKDEELPEDLNVAFTKKAKGVDKVVIIIEISV